MPLTNKVRTIVLSSFISIISLTSCITTDNTLGSVYIPSDQDITIKTVDFNLPVTLKMADSLQSSISSSIMVGAISTQKFGTTLIGTAVSFTPATDSIVWGTDPVFKEMYMEVAVSSKTTLSTDQENIPQNIYAYQLNFELDSTYVYNNSITSSDYYPTPISIGNTTYLGGDSLKMYFTKEFTEKFFSATREELDSAALFMKRFYGLYLTTDPPIEGTTGGRINNLDLETAYTVLSYTSTNDLGVRRDTSVSFMLGDYYITNTFKNSSQNLINDNPQDILYVEGLSGIKPHISAKALKKLINDWATQNSIDISKILIARASLEFPYDYPSNYTELNTYPSMLFPCQRLTGDIYTMYSPIAEIYDSNFNNGSINRSLSYYKPDVSLFLQDLLKKDDSKITEKDDLWMMATLTVTNSSSGTTYYYADYSTYFTATLNGLGSTRPPKLRLTYTILK